MRQSQNWLTVYLIPVLLGLIIALLIILIKPDWFPQLNTPQQQPTPLAAINPVPIQGYPIKQGLSAILLR